MIPTPPPEQLAGPRISAWFHVSSLPLSVLIPSVLWLILKAGLFLVGAIVSRIQHGAIRERAVLQRAGSRRGSRR